MSNCNTTPEGDTVVCGTELYRDGDSDGNTIVRAECSKCKKERQMADIWANLVPVVY